MAHPYRELLATPGAKSFTAAGFVMRLPISMVGIGIVLLVSATSGSYGLAGVVAATYALVQAVAQPQVARVVDRVGQARVILPALAVNAVGLVGLVACALLGLATWTLLVTAAVAGAAFVPVGSLVRARWGHALAGTPLLDTAYSFESVVDELIFIMGPVVVTLLATRVAPAAGLLSAVAFVTIGTLALAPQRATQPPSRPPSSARARAAIRQPGVRVLTVVFVGVGSIFGSVEVIAVAFTEERGRPAAAALVLALFAFGSMLSGVVYGSVRWRTSLERRFLLAVLALGGVSAVFPLVSRIPVLAVLALVGGFAISPTIIAGYGLVKDLVPAESLTEGLSWVSAGIGIGVSLGSSAAGLVIDAAGAQRAFLVSLASGVTAALLVGAFRRWLCAPPAGACLADV